MARRTAIALSICAVSVMFAWNFVPEEVTFEGESITCWPASVDRSSPPEEVGDRMLACRPTATRRELQGFGGLAVALLLIWVGYRATTDRRTVDQVTPGT